MYLSASSWSYTSWTYAEEQVREWLRLVASTDIQLSWSSSRACLYKCLCLLLWQEEFVCQACLALTLTSLFRKFTVKAGCTSSKVDTSIFPHSRMIPCKKHQTVRLRASVITWNVAVEGIYNFNETVSLSKCWHPAFLRHNSQPVTVTCRSSCCMPWLRFLYAWVHKDRPETKENDQEERCKQLSCQSIKKYHLSKDITIHHNKGRSDEQPSDPLKDSIDKNSLKQNWMIMSQGSLQSALNCRFPFLVFRLQLVITSLVVSIPMVKLVKAASFLWIGKYIFEQFH